MMDLRLFSETKLRTKFDTIMGPVRAQDVDAAQANLVKIVFRLSNNGDILLTLKEDIGKMYL